MIGLTTLFRTTAAERGNADLIPQDESAELAGGNPFLFNEIRQAGLSARVE